MKIGDLVEWVGHHDPVKPLQPFRICARYEPGHVFETLAGVVTIAEVHYDLATPNRPNRVLIGPVGESKLRKVPA